MKVIIDRLEEDTAIVELDGELLSVPRALVGDAAEGDAVMITPLGSNASLADAENPHSLFERLRHKRRRKH